MNFYEDPRFCRLDKRKQKILIEIAEKSSRYSMEELLPQILQINQELNRRNMNFTKEESALLMDIIEESLSPAEKQKFNMVKGFLS